MATKRYPSVKSFVKRVVDYAKKHHKNKEIDVFCSFIKIFYSHVDTDDFAGYSAAQLYAMAWSLWRYISEFDLNGIQLRVFNPTEKTDGWSSEHTIVQLVVRDMPFIIDSMRMEMNRLGITVHTLIYTGGLQVERNEAKRITQVYPYGERRRENCEMEAPIFMEIDKQTSKRVLKQIETNLRRVVRDVVLTVSDWQLMREKMRESIEEISHKKLPQPAAEVMESKIFLEWLLDNHFTFLGVRDYVVSGSGSKRGLRLVKGSGLGVLRDDSTSKMYRLFSEFPVQARDLMLSNEHILIISKTNTRSTVHRSTHTDYIGVKRFNEKGELIGERRFIGLYTSTGYHSLPSEIPFLRHKVASVLKRSGLPESSHAGKDLINILATMPRDDVFQATPNELYRLSMGILHLQERRRVRLFVREDAYGRYVSCLVYIPRENFNTRVLRTMENILMNAFSGLELTFNTYFSASVLARIHFVIRIDPTKRLRYNLEKLEARLAEAGASWPDTLRKAVLDKYGEELGNKIITQYHNAFPAGYREANTVKQALYDIAHMQNLTTDDMLEMSMYRPDHVAKNILQFKLFRKNHTIPLSDVLPMFENMGLRVMREQPYCVKNVAGDIWINDFTMEYPVNDSLPLAKLREIFQEAFTMVWYGIAENDTYNRLVLTSGLSWREIALLRAYTKYLRQVGVNYSLEYMAETFVNNVKHTKLFIELFHEYFNPKHKQNKNRIKSLEKIYIDALDEVASLDEDRILRLFLDILQATLRTNFFQFDKQSGPKSYISLKLDPRAIPDMPLPLPRYEIFVYSARFEGVHLRMGKVARGGLRWSDRREDFRTEILGLMKAQQVKNALIIPSGAKGGFVPKRAMPNATRQEILDEAIACYKDFISGLLDITDNLVNKKVVHPAKTVCYDDEDEYLVVAADKGTASFSDIANAISIERDYWLGDAFASGGSTGYDHKKMGITARGAWVSAERQFLELGINVDLAEITVVGIGDMNGDVFGNGMLLSDNLKLLAAFNHQHIFIDPNPEPKKSFKERKRIFKLKRSSWDDYNKDLISAGGGVFERSAKAIKISPQMKQAFNISKDTMVPNELIKALLCAPVDMIWNGGIGTFVKASDESNNDVGDRTNDGIRVNGYDLNARVVVEGGNLGFTQAGRNEFDLNGGKINTDFIDNSAGVDCSDHEVNIKILLNHVVEKGKLTQAQRNKLLSKMSEEVAELVLQNNYHQNEVISFASYISPHMVPIFAYYLEDKFKKGLINRELEKLPNEQILLQRKVEGAGLTKPEIAVLMAYSKILLEKEIRDSDLPDDHYLQEYVKDAFPTPLRNKYEDEIFEHPLKRAIISTQISNHMVSDMGITFAHRMFDETGADISMIVRAYEVAKSIFSMEQFYADIEALDYKVNPELQHKMINEVIRLVRRTVRWFLRNTKMDFNIEEQIAFYAPRIEKLNKHLPLLVSGSNKDELENYHDTMIENNIPQDLAMRIASILPMYHALNIIEVTKQKSYDLLEVAKIYFTLIDKLDLLWFRRQINLFTSDNHWTALASAAYKSDLDWIHRKLTLGVLHTDAPGNSISSKINVWLECHKDLIDRWQEVITNLRNTDYREYAMLAVAIRELSDLAKSMQRIA